MKNKYPLKEIAPIKVQIKNYRSIPVNTPVTLTLREGIQFIVGVNNVGKSNLLKFFSELRECLYTNHHNPQPDKSNYIDLKVHYDSIVNHRGQDLPITIDLEYKNLKEKITIETRNPYKHITHAYIVNTYSDYLTRQKQDAEALEEMIGTLVRVKYISASRISINQASGKHHDVHIGQSFMQTWHNWAVSSGERDKMEKISVLIEELRELFGYTKLDISSSGTDMIIKSDDGVFSINELGNGISQIILALGSALFEEPTYILIDEPEIGLHPRLQEAFIRSLAAKATYGLIATSHSIGLARSVADEIFTLTKENGKPKLVPYGKHYASTIAQSISELGFSQYVEIGGNHLLLVEGPTDIKCFREILRKWGIDKNFIVMSLGGGDFISDNATVSGELNELKRLNTKSINIIVDSERIKAGGAPSKRVIGFTTICEALGFNVFSTEFHSTENYISQNALNIVLGKGYTALKPYQNFNDSQQKWSKDKNWLLFRQMNKDDFKDTELKTFIERKLIPLTHN